ncbi:MAG: glucose-6-phosphate isomerase, partial [Duodenibacillus sp.]
MTKTSVPFLRDTYSDCVYSACGLTVDIGRQRLTRDDLTGLFELARSRGVLKAEEAMRDGA